MINAELEPFYYLREIENKDLGFGYNLIKDEVTDFYNAFKYQLPQVKDEVVLSKIVMFPKLTDAHKQEIIDQLKKIKQDILNGETFENKARIYSDDPGSAANGGLYTNIGRGKMDKNAYL